MAIFVAALDESDGGHHRSVFWHCGWIGPEKDWSSYFTPAWQERVLDAKPKIPFLHMTDIRDPGWCKKHGVSWLQAQDKMDEAAILINQMGSLFPLVIDTSGAAFLDAHGKKKFIKGGEDNKAARFLVDHFSFLVYVYGVLQYVHQMHPEVEKVDFVIERKEGVFEKLKRFYDTFENSLDYVQQPELKKYLGECIPAGKDRVPVQMADMLCWHASRAALGLLKGRDAMRFVTIFSRPGSRLDVPDDIHSGLAHIFTEKLNEGKDGVSSVRRDNEEANPSSARKDQSGHGRGKNRKAQKA